LEKQVKEGRKEKNGLGPNLFGHPRPKSSNCFFTVQAQAQGPIAQAQSELGSSTVHKPNPNWASDESKAQLK
jgi:hypothetical protein